MRIYALLLSVVFTQACRTGGADDSEVKAEFGPNGVPIDWGSLQPMSATPLTNEGKLANAAARRLNDAARLKELLVGMPDDAKVEDGIVSVPVKMLANDDDGANHPFGDGQKNASLGWAGWPSQNADVPVALTLAYVKTTAAEGRLLVVEPSLDMVNLVLGSAPAALSAEFSSDQGDTMTVGLTKDIGRGVYRGVVVIGSALSGIQGSSNYPATVAPAANWLSALGDRWAWPRIKVRFFSGTPTDQRYWPVLFRFPAQARDAAETTLPASERTFPSTGRSIGMPPYEGQPATTASDALKTWLDSQPASAKPADFYPASGNSGVHDLFTDHDHHQAHTATGGVDTYVLKSKVGHSEILYTCFDARNPVGEAQWGVPSGAGWHSIGHELPPPNDTPEKWTFAESIVNTFEKTGIFAGWGVRTPYPFSESAPFDAKDVATFRVLRAGEAFTTAKKHFHWYAVDASQKVCTIIWKHKDCKLKSDRDLACDPS